MTQANFSQYNINNTAQSQYLNPAFRPSSKVGISIAPFSNLLNVQFLHTGFALKDAFTPRTNSDTLDLTLGKLVDNLNKVNYLDFNMQNELLAFQVTTKKTSVNFTVNSVFRSGFSYPKDLLRFAYYGNGGEEYLGKRVAFDNIGFDALWYLEFGVGLNRKIGDKLTVGAKVKFLKGIASFQTAESQFGLYTDPKTYALEVDGAMALNYNNLAALEGLQNNSSDLGAIYDSVSTTKNIGLGLDLGATFQLTKKIMLSASVIDLGAIKWKDNVTNYKVNPFTFEYKGVDVDKYLNDTSDYFQELVDSLTQLTTVVTTHNTYSTKLYSKFYIGGSYDLTKFLNVGAVWYNSFNPGRYITALNLSGNVKLKHWIGVSGNVSFYNYKDVNLGAGINLRGGPFQIYFMTDNVLSVMYPEAAKNVHFNFGMSFQIGKTKEYKKKGLSIL
ncbi:hypothetical protein DNU06_10415 [Putridiphycobacter roseus]|uniref:DUF5723 domain-containing protein n=2 Tax=Putridiphycobacter roseus TaxID=2219161 RepID=A0A2W1NGN6_9FLAO|nr:hypothetical protein DNU06_10415 [Putridiphycobacter roseus]